MNVYLDTWKFKILKTNRLNRELKRFKFWNWNIKSNLLPNASTQDSFAYTRSHKKNRIVLHWDVCLQTWVLYCSSIAPLPKTLELHIELEIPHLSKLVEILWDVPETDLTKENWSHAEQWEDGRKS